MTGLEVLQKVLEKLDEIDKLKTEVMSLVAKIDDVSSSVKLIEQNIKVLNNRAGSLMRGDNVAQTIQPEPQPQAFPVSAYAPLKQDNVGQQVLPAPTQLSSPQKSRPLSENVEQPQYQPIKPFESINTYKKAFGRLVNNAKEPIEGALIKIYDTNNEVCATTETDITGHWESQVRPGRYSMEIVKASFKPINKSFDVKERDVEVEVR